VQVKMVGVFIRKFEINSCGKSLTLCQKEVGDVSCVIWDAALVLAKYLEATAGKNKNIHLFDPAIRLSFLLLKMQYT
jgi:hypothetical protein